VVADERQQDSEEGPFTFHLSLFTVSPLPRPLPGPMRRHLRSVPAGAHAAPTTPVILCRIVKQQITARIRAFSNQRRVPITEEVRGGLSERC
jgi:hypothetical protein